MNATDCPFLAGAKKAEAHLVNLLDAAGVPHEPIRHNLVFTKGEGNQKVELLVHVGPHFKGSWSREKDGINIRINRSDRAVNYSKKSSDPAAFDWKKIVKAIVDDLDYRFKNRQYALKDEADRRNNEALAAQEVPVQDNLNHSGRFRRTRNWNGSYQVTVNCGDFTAQEARDIRDIVQKIINRYEAKKTQEASASSGQKAA